MLNSSNRSPLPSPDWRPRGAVTGGVVPMAGKGDAVRRKFTSTAGFGRSVWIPGSSGWGAEGIFLPAFSGVFSEWGGINSAFVKFFLHVRNLRSSLLRSEILIS